MSQQLKSALYQALKSIDVPFAKHYREYTVPELQQAYDAAVAGGLIPGDQLGQADAAPELDDEPLDSEAAAFFGFDAPSPAPSPEIPVSSEPSPPAVPVAARDPEELAGARQNTRHADEPIRIDPETGRIWYQEEVLKPAYPKPRGRRVMKYQDAGVEQQTVKSGDFTETFEIAGDPANAETREVKITLPSYQVGIFKDPRFPFKVVTYNGRQGFDLFEVQNYYGGAEMVPPEVKRMYVANVLCYDIRTVIRSIQAEYRRIQLSRSPGALAASQL